MKVELIVQPNRKLTLSSFEKRLDGSGRASLEIISGRFSYFTSEFDFDDLVKFTEELKSIYQSLSGSAELSFHNENECLQFTAKSMGHIEFTGEFFEYGEVQQALKCGFEFDQSYLPNFIEQLEYVLCVLYS